MCVTVVSLTVMALVARRLGEEARKDKDIKCAWHERTGMMHSHCKLINADLRV